MAAAIRMSLLFAFRIEPAVAYLRPVVRLVPRLVLASRSCLVGWRSRVGVSSLVSSRLVSAFRVVSRFVSALFYRAVFVSSCSRVVSSVLVVVVARFVFVPSCVSDGVGLSGALRRGVT